MIISTGSRMLDEAWGGGLKPRTTYAVIGDTETGKSSICMSSAARHLKLLNEKEIEAKVIYIFCDGIFPVERWNTICECIEVDPVDKKFEFIDIDHKKYPVDDIKSLTTRHLEADKPRKKRNSPKGIIEEILQGKYEFPKYSGLYLDAFIHRFERSFDYMTMDERPRYTQTLKYIFQDFRDFVAKNYSILMATCPVYTDLSLGFMKDYTLEEYKNVILGGKGYIYAIEEKVVLLKIKSQKDGRWGKHRFQTIGSDKNPPKEGMFWIRSDGVGDTEDKE